MNQACIYLLYLLAALPPLLSLSLSLTARVQRLEGPTVAAGAALRQCLSDKVTPVQPVCSAN